MTQRGAAIIDTKSDFYSDFYRTGDIVINNDERTTSGNGQNFQIKRQQEKTPVVISSNCSSKKWVFRTETMKEGGFFFHGTGIE